MIYDVSIIGAGISGLVCGTYLAKAGLKVVIVDMNKVPGGYAVSFSRGNYVFNAAVHSIGGCRKNGPLGVIFQELGLIEKLKFERLNPSDLFITPSGEEFYLRNDPLEVKEELISRFPKERKGLEDIFRIFLKLPFDELKHKTFKVVLDKLFKNKDLKYIFSVILTELGVPPSRLSALAAAVHFREFILDGGYHVKNGIQNLVNLLVDEFINFGGSILLGKKVEKIEIKNEKIQGILTDDGKFINSKIVISCCDASETFLNLVGKEKLTEEFANSLLNLEPSISTFIVYAGLKKKFNTSYNIWKFYNEDIEDYYKKIQDGLIDKEKSAVLCSFLTGENSSQSLNIFLNTPFKSEEFWKSEKRVLADFMVEKASELLRYPTELIEIEDMATPFSFYKYTLNRNGARVGWAPLLNQVGHKVMPVSTMYESLFLAGHWATAGFGQGGISTSAFSGRFVAKRVLIQKKIFNL